MFLRVRRRYERVLLAAALLTFTYITLCYRFVPGPDAAYPAWHPASVLSLAAFNRNFLDRELTDADADISHAKLFEASVDKLYAKKAKLDLQFALRALDPQYYIQESYLPLTIPAHFYSSTPAPRTQPFDPRFTIAIYLSSLRHQRLASPDKLPRVPFHWGDWKDLSYLDEYIYRAPSNRTTCAIMDTPIPGDPQPELPAQPELLEAERSQWEELRKVWTNFEKYRSKPNSQVLREEDIKAEQIKVKQRLEKIRKDAEEAARKKKEEEEKAARLKKMAEEQRQREEKIRVEHMIRERLINEAKEKQRIKMQEVEGTSQTNEKNKKSLANTNEKNKKSPAKTNEKNKLDLKSLAKTSSKKIRTSPKNLKRHNPKGHRRLNVAEFCLNDDQLPRNMTASGPGFNLFKQPGKTLVEHALLAGNSFLYTLAPPPLDIIFLTKKGSYHLAVAPAMSKLLENGMVQEYVSRLHPESSKPGRISARKEFDQLRRDVEENADHRIDDYRIHLLEDDFEFDVKAKIAEYQLQLRQNPHSLGERERRYFNSLLYSEHVGENAPKYFFEAGIEGNELGDHYDWRFFNGLTKDKYEQELVLHRLVRAWLSFSRKHSLNTWIAHGSLLSWYWNSVDFPWDDDIDVQMPLRDLHKLALHFNNSLIVEDVEEGFGRYFIDCGTFLTRREHDKGKNLIDARFIDVDTGIYIDITALALLNEQTKDRYRKDLPKDWAEIPGEHKLTNRQLRVYNCRNKHFSSLLEISPLIRTVIEGEHGFVPHKFVSVLQAEYADGLERTLHENHVFLRKLRLWVKERDLYYFLTQRKKWNLFHQYDQKLVAGKDSDLDVLRAEQLGELGYEPTHSEIISTQREAIRRFQNHEHISQLEDLMWTAAGPVLTRQQLSHVQEMSDKDLLEFLDKDEIFIDYYETRDVTRFHEAQMMRLLAGKPTERMVRNAPHFGPLKCDPFLHRKSLDLLSWEDTLKLHANMVKSGKFPRLSKPRISWQDA